MASEGLTSIIVPVWNRGSTLARTLESILVLRGAIEVVVVDNGSDDPTEVGELVSGIGDSRLRVIRLPHNLGPGGGRNAGVTASVGEFVGFVDSDDTVDVNWLEQSLEPMADPKVIGVTSAVRTLRSSGAWGPVEGPTPHVLLLGGFTGRFGGPPTFVVRRSVFDAVGGYDEQFWYGENLELWVRITNFCAQGGWRLASIPAPLGTWYFDGYDDHRYDSARRSSVDLMLRRHGQLLHRDREARCDLLAVGGAIAARNGDLRAARRYFLRSVLAGRSLRAMGRLVLSSVPPLARRRWQRV